MTDATDHDLLIRLDTNMGIVLETVRALDCAGHCERIALLEDHEKQRTARMGLIGAIGGTVVMIAKLVWDTVGRKG